MLVYRFCPSCAFYFARLGKRQISMVGQASCLSVQARCLHYQIQKRYFSNSHIP